MIIPAPKDKSPAYQMFVIDDSEKGFPAGESRIVSLINIDSALHAGEHKLQVKPGKITRVPPVTKVNKYNMAQTNFYYQSGESWTAFTERQLPYSNACRRLFIIHATPGALAPRITTVVDVNPYRGRASR